MPWPLGLALERASDSDCALGVQPCSPFFPSISKLWNLGAGGSTHGLSCPGNRILLTSGPIALYSLPVWGLTGKGLSPGPVYAVTAVAKQKTWCRGLDVWSVLPQG